MSFHVFAQFPEYLGLKWDQFNKNMSGAGCCGICGASGTSGALGAIGI